MRCSLHVHREEQVAAGNRVVTLQHAQNPPLRVGLDALMADLAVKPVFVGRLDTRLSDMGRSSIVGLIDAVELALVDAADIPDEVDSELAMRVVAGQSRVDVDPGEAVSIDRESGDLVVVEPQAQRDLLETGLAGQDSQEFLFVRIGDFDDLAQLADQRVDVFHQLGNDLETVGRQVLRQNFTVAVEDEPPRRCNRDDLDAVVLRQSGEVPMLENLQMGESPDEREREQPDDDRRSNGTRRRQVRLAGEILDCEQPRHRWSPLPIWCPISAVGTIRAVMRVDARHTAAYRRLTTRRTTNSHGHNNVLTSGEVQYAVAATGMPRMPLLQRTSAW